MPMIPFQPNTRIRSADVNANFANALALDTPRTVIVTHTWNALQVFGNGIQVTGAVTLGGDVSVTGDLSVDGSITASAVAQADRFLADSDSPSAPAFSDQNFPDSGIYFGSAGGLNFSFRGDNHLNIADNEITAQGGVRFVGNGSGLTNLPAASLTGNISPARLSSVPAGSLTGEVAMARLPLLQFTIPQSGFSIGPRDRHSIVVTANAVTASSSAFVNSSLELLGAALISVEVDRCETNQVFMTYRNHSETSTVGVPDHTLRVGVLRFQ